MGFRMQDFMCDLCEHTQEELVSTTSSSNSSECQTDSNCDNCGASSDHLKPTIGLSSHGGHVSWSKWRAI